MLHPTTAEYSLFSSSQGKFTTTDHKTNLKFKRVEIKQSILFDHEIKLEVNDRKKKKTGKTSQMSGN